MLSSRTAHIYFFVNSKSTFLIKISRITAAYQHRDSIVINLYLNYSGLDNHAVKELPPNKNNNNKLRRYKIIGLFVFSHKIISFHMCTFITMQHKWCPVANVCFHILCSVFHKNLFYSLVDGKRVNWVDIDCLNSMHTGKVENLQSHVNLNLQHVNYSLHVLFLNVAVF